AARRYDQEEGFSNRWRQRIRIHLRIAPGHRGRAARIVAGAEAGRQSDLRVSESAAARQRMDGHGELIAHSARRGEPVKGGSRTPSGGPGASTAPRPRFRTLTLPQFGEGTTIIRAIMPPSSCSRMWQW